MTTGRTNERTDGRSPIPPSLFWRGHKILSKMNCRNKKKIYISCKSIPFPPLILFHTPPKKPLPICIKFATAHTFIIPLTPLAGGIYIVYVRLSLSTFLTAYAIPPQQLDGIESILQEFFSTKWHGSLRNSLVPNGVVHLLFLFSHFYISC